MATTEAPKAKAPAKTEPVKMTEYVVLMLSKPGATAEICVIGRASGTTDVKAIEAALGDSPVSAGVAFVAVPARSWRERQPTVNTIVRTTWA